MKKVKLIRKMMFAKYSSKFTLFDELPKEYRDIIRQCDYNVYPVGNLKEFMAQYPSVDSLKNALVNIKIGVRYVA